MNNTDFVKELTALLNRACRENESNTPDYILAEYLMDSLDAYDKATSKRDEWHGRALKPSPLPVDDAAEARYEALLAEKRALGVERRRLMRGHDSSCCCPGCRRDAGEAKCRTCGGAGGTRCGNPECEDPKCDPCFDCGGSGKER
jgi:hypothetical protein